MAEAEGRNALAAALDCPPQRSEAHGAEAAALFAAIKLKCGPAAADRLAKEHMQAHPPAFDPLALAPEDADLTGPKERLAGAPVGKGHLAPL